MSRRAGPSGVLGELRGLVEARRAIGELIDGAVRRCLDSGVEVASLSRTLGVHRSTIYRTYLTEPGSRVPQSRAAEGERGDGAKRSPAATLDGGDGRPTLAEGRPPGPALAAHEVANRAGAIQSPAPLVSGEASAADWLGDELGWEPDRDDESESDEGWPD